MRAKADKLAGLQTRTKQSTEDCWRKRRQVSITYLDGFCLVVGYKESKNGGRESADGNPANRMIVGVEVREVSKQRQRWLMMEAG